MVVYSIKDKIICEYEDLCSKYSACSKNSICPNCKNNKWINPESLKKNYFKPKLNPMFVTSMMCIAICLIITLLL